MSGKPQVPVIEGWFTQGAEPHLIGVRCTRCGTYFFPRTQTLCANPSCGGQEFEQVELSRRGRLWSFTENRYPPPEPYVSPDPFVPYTVAAVELERERMIVLGQVSAGVDPESLQVGAEVELGVGKLYEDEQREYLVWNWRPVDGARPKAP
jgi:uncharacterized OB-fold protein